MTLTVHTHSEKETEFILRLLTRLQQTGTEIRVFTANSSGSRTSNDMQGVANRLRGRIQLPVDFDYKKTLAEALMVKHG